MFLLAWLGPFRRCTGDADGLPDTPSSSEWEMKEELWWKSQGKGLNSNERTSNKFKEKLGGSEVIGQSRIGEMALHIDILNKCSNV